MAVVEIVNDSTAVEITVPLEREVVDVVTPGPQGPPGPPGPATSDASTTTKGVTRLSSAPVSATDPIAAGDNDPRLTDTRAPTAHAHPQSDVTGLAGSLVAKADLAGGLVPTSQIPALATGETVTVASQPEMLALTASQVQPGDVAIRSDQAGRRWLLAAADPSLLASWIALEVPDAVSSVNSQQGAVVLGKGDVGLGSVDDTADTAKPVSTAQQTAFDAKQDAASAATDAELAAHTNLTTGAHDLAALLAAKSVETTRAASGKGYIAHGAVAGTARPTGYASIEWVGSVSPTNITTADTWINTT